MDTVNEVTKEATKSGSLLKEAGKFGAGAAIGIGTFVLVRKAVGKISDIRKAKKLEAAEEVDINEDEFDIEVAEEN